MCICVCVFLLGACELPTASCRVKRWDVWISLKILSALSEVRQGATRMRKYSGLVCFPQRCARRLIGCFLAAFKPAYLRDHCSNKNL